MSAKFEGAFLFALINADYKDFAAIQGLFFGGYSQVRLKLGKGMNH
jgi:hypothetical protein